MADGVQITLDGDRDIIEELKQLRDYLPNNFVRKAVRAAADMMRVEILQRVPIRTGNLFNNIDVRIRRTAQTIRARVTINTAGKAGANGNAFYWRFIEFGHHDRAGQMVAAEPFVTPAFDARNRDAAQEVIDSVERALDKAQSKARRIV